MINWRIVYSGVCSPEMNMAIDEAILLGVLDGDSKPTIRFYQWNNPTLSLGMNQTFKAEIDLTRATNNGFSIVRRPTGGRLVLHNEEVTYSVIAPLEGRLNGNVTDSYKEISQALACGLKEMGVDVDFEKKTLSADSQRQSGNPCFSSTSRYELAYNKKKIVGSAQVRKDKALLQHGSILTNHNQELISEVIPNISSEQRIKLKNYLSRKTISLRQILQKEIMFDEMVEKLISGFVKAWHDDNFETESKLSDIEIVKAVDLAKNKYSKDNWIYRK